MSDQEKVVIGDLDKAAVLATLFNATTPGGMGFLQANRGPSVMTIEDAQQLIQHGTSPDPGSSGRGYLYFDYLYGRPLKVNLSGAEFDPWGFDRDNGGPGTAARLIEELRQTGEVNSSELSDRRKSLLIERANDTMEFAGTPSMGFEDGTFLLGGDDVGAVLVQAVDKETERLIKDW